MPASIRDLKEWQEVKMFCLNFTTDSETDICVNIYGNLKNSDRLHVPVVEDALMDA